MIRTRNLPFAATVVIFVLAYALCVLQFPNMLSYRVVGNLLTDNAFIGIAAVGMTFVILSGGIDLSVGAVIAFTSVLVAVLVRDGMHPALAFAIALALSTAFGALMGWTIHTLAMPAFVVTLAGMFLARGGAFLISTDSVPIGHEFLGTLKGLYIQLPGKGRLTFLAMVMLATFVVGAFIAHRTRFGANVYALGGSTQSAELMGVPVRGTTIRLYALSGFLAGLAGLAYTLYTSAGYSLATVGVELDAIAAVVVGGTLLTGGSGLVFGTLLGVLIQGLIQTYIVFDGTLSSWWTKIVIGLLLFAFILLQKVILLLPGRSGKAVTPEFAGNDMGLLESRLKGATLRSSHALVVEELGRAIVGGDIPEGALLPGDQELMERFHVSRTVLREAMKTLAAKRLIEAKSRVGTRICARDRWNFVDPDVIGWRMRAGMDPDFVTHLAEMRLALEPATAALAARNATEAEIAELMAIARRMDNPAHSRESIARVDLEFHLAVAQMSRNPFIRSVSGLIEAALAVTFQISSPALSREGIAQCADTHLSIANAIARRDEAAAAQAMRLVIDVGVSRTIAALG